MKPSLICLVLFLNHTLWALASKPTTGHITIYAPQAKGQLVKLSTPNLLTLSSTPLTQQTVDATGTLALTVPLAKTQFTKLEIGAQRYDLLLSPGDQLHIELANAPADSARFSGRGSVAARYLQGIAAIYRREGRNLLLLDSARFVQQLQLIRQAYAQYSQQFGRQQSMPPATSYLLEQKNALQLLSFQLNYTMARYNPSDTSGSLLPKLLTLVNEVPLDARLLAANLNEYGIVLDMYLQAGFYGPLVIGQTTQTRLAQRAQLPRLVDQRLRKHPCPSRLRTFLRAKNLVMTLGQGITPVTDSLLAALQQTPDYALYAADIRQRYAQQTLLVGRAAPNFSGITPAGQVLSLADLKGKVVYVDVWATWCVPCREEFPQAKQLQQQFSHSDQVAFLYVSIDRDAAAWRKFLAQDPAFQGVHINQPPGVHYDSLWKTYQLSSIPRYILIDRLGKIVSVNAERPSSGKVAGQIDQLLH